LIRPINGKVFKPINKTLLEPPMKTDSRTLIFDLETNGLLNDVTQIHCIAYHESDRDEISSFNDECPGKGMSSSITNAVCYLQHADCIIGHNIIGYDLPVIKKLYPFFEYNGTVIDTLLLSRLYHTRLYELDKKFNWPYMPLQLYGRHSLESYGYRLGEYKGNFSKTTDWKEWSQEMEDYCVQDVEVTKKLWKHFHPYLDGSKWSTR